MNPTQFIEEAKFPARLCQWTSFIYEAQQWDSYKEAKNAADYITIDAFGVVVVTDEGEKVKKEDKK